MLDQSKPIAVAHRVAQMQLAALALGVPLESLDPESAQAAEAWGLKPPSQVLSPKQLARRVSKVRRKLGQNPEAYLNYLKRYGNSPSPTSRKGSAQRPRR